MVFFTTYWDIVGLEVVKTVQSFFRTESMLKEINYTVISLIPKSVYACTPSQFNVVYKIISKILSNRIKGFLPDLISPFQAAFIPNRHISENVVLTHEVIHSFSKKKGGVGAMAIKMDMAKAYDKLEWSFIRAVLCNFGFSNHFVKLIIECITSPTFSILLNGSPGGGKNSINKRDKTRGPSLPFHFHLML